MLQVRNVNRESLLEEGLIDQIIEFEKVNLQEVLANAGDPFDEKKRRESLEKVVNVSLVFDEEEQLVGVLDFGFRESAPNELYIFSLQLDKKYRKGIYIYQLLVEARKEMLNHPFEFLRCNVHKTNRVAINLYRKLGFNLEESPANPKLYQVTAPRQVLDNEIYQQMERRFLALQCR